MQDEESFVRRAQQHDQAALTRIYEENFDKIYRYIVLKIGEKTEAEDMTQQVFLNAFKNISSFKYKKVPLSSWLFRIAHNQIVDYLRRKSKRATVPLNESLAKAGDDPKLEVERDFDIMRLVSATKQLTGAQREVISLRFAAELSVRQVARVMNKSEGAIKALQHSAIVSLRKVLSAG